MEKRIMYNKMFEELTGDDFKTISKHLKKWNGLEMDIHQMAMKTIEAFEEDNELYTIEIYYKIKKSVKEIRENPDKYSGEDVREVGSYKDRGTAKTLVPQRVILKGIEGRRKISIERTDNSKSKTKTDKLILKQSDNNMCSMTTQKTDLPIVFVSERGGYVKYDKDDYFRIKYDDLGMTTEQKKNMKQMREKAVKEIEEELNINLSTGNLSEVEISKILMKNCLNIEMEHVSFDEFTFIHHASVGSLLYSAQSGKEFEGYNSFDVNSMYLWMLSSMKMKIPIREGRIIKIKTFKEKYVNVLGIYKIIIKGDTKNIFFRTSEEGYYTNHDLKTLFDCKIDFEMDDDEFNAIVWDSPDMYVEGSTIFGEMMRELYKMKVKKNIMAKAIMSASWGLCSKMNSKIENMKTMTPEKAKELKDSDRVIAVFPIRKEIEYLLEDRPYKHAIARLKPFLLSMCRNWMSNLARKIKHDGYNILRIHTDCILSDIPVNKFSKLAKIGSELGEFKLELSKINPENKYKIKHINSILKWDEEKQKYYGDTWDYSTESYIRKYE